MKRDASRSLLIVEDDRVSRELLRRMLAAAGCEEAGSLDQAFVRLSGGRFDAVLLDLNLPDSAGLETLRKLNSRFPSVPIVVITGAYEEDLGLEALTSGAQDYLVKGRYDAYTLNKCVEYTIERKKAEDALRKAYDEMELRVQERTRELMRANRLLQTEITERTRVQGELKVSETRLRTVLETVREGITFSDEKGYFYIYNPEMERLTGYTWDEANSSDFTELIFRTPEERERAIRGIAELNEKGTAREVETRIHTKTGEIRYVQISSYLVYSTGRKMYLSVFRDITRRKADERLLKMSEKRYRAIVEDQTELILRFVPGGAITFVNEAFCRYYGIPRRSLIGKNALEFIPEEDRERVSSFVHSLGPDQPFGTHEHKAYRNGELRWQQWTDRAIFDEKGAVVEYQGVGSDITERKWAEEQLNAAHRELEHRVEERTGELARANDELRREVAERRHKEEQLEASLKEKEVLLKEVNHRVKNNLQIISSLLHLQSKYIVDSADSRMFSECQNRIKSMVFIHEKLYRSKDFAHIDFGNYISVLARSLFNSYSISGDRVSLRLTTGEGISFGVDRAIPCGLIVNELVSNSLKYAFPNDAKGTIDIDFRQNPDSTFTLAVRDDGVGLPAGLDYRNTQSLGLQLVMTLVEQLNGSLRAGKGPGTEFVIDFGEPVEKGKP